jgi:pilus assembly protein CpaE
MSHSLRVCLYNAEPEASEALCEAIGALHFVRLVAEVDGSEALANVLAWNQVNLVFFHLDPDPDAVVTMIDQVATRYPDLALIAISHQTDPKAILAPMRAGCEQFVCEPIDREDLAAAVSRVASKRQLGQAVSRCLCVTGASGGAGATSIACNMAMEIGHLSERDCALVDLDLQFGDVALNFDCEAKYSLYDLAAAGTDLDESVLSSVINTLPCKVAIVARPELMEQQDAVTAEAVHRVIELLLTTHESVVVDVPRNLNALTMAALSHADIIFLVCQLLVPSVRNAKRYLEALQRMGVPDDRIEVIVNRTDRRNSRFTVEDIEETFKRPVYTTIPNDYQFVARAIDFGRPIAALGRDNPVRVAIRKMARGILADPTSVSKKKQTRRSLLGRLLAK